MNHPGFLGPSNDIFRANPRHENAPGRRLFALDLLQKIYAILCILQIVVADDEIEPSLALETTNRLFVTACAPDFPG